MAVVLSAVTSCGGSSDKELKAIVLDMCKFIPDHGLRDDAEENLTKSYFDAYSGALNSIPENDGMIGDEEFLYYFVSGLLSILMMWYLRATTDDNKLLATLEERKKARKSNPKKTMSMMERMQAMAEQQRRLKEEQRRNDRK